MIKNPFIAVRGVQFNSRVGDLSGNAGIMAGHIRQHVQINSHTPTLLVFPEMALTGYPLQDLVRQHQFSDDARQVVEELARLTTTHVAALIGLSWREGRRIYNAVAFCEGGRIAHVFTKTNLPNDSVFDEVRTYTAGKPSVATWQGVTFGVPICEDVWHAKVCKAMKRMGAQLLLSPNASPYNKGKWPVRLKVLKRRLAQTQLPMLYLNRWGGQDELVFDGQSALLLPNGNVHRAAMYDDAEIAFTFNGAAVGGIHITNPFVQKDEWEECWQHLKLGLADYVGRHKKGKAVLGLSGGIESALVACMAAETLGQGNLLTIGMPSKFSSTGSVDDAKALADALGVTFWKKPIEKIVAADRETLSTGDGAFNPEGVTDENLQARARGKLLMAYSNAGYGMVLTTGNKSEMSVGYSTLYGDMNGSYNPIKDLYKTEVFALCRWLAERYRKSGNVAAAEALMRIINKPPSAELRPNQKDEDSLPAYPVLDAILVEIIEKLKVPGQIRLRGIASAVVEKVYLLVKNAEFKRRQACPGTRWHRGDLDKEWRMPLDNGYTPLTEPLRLAA